jgi:hypothetical protein
MLPFGTFIEEVNTVFWEFVSLGRRESPVDVGGCVSAWAVAEDGPALEMGPAAGVDGVEVCICRHDAGQNSM